MQVWQNRPRLVADLLASGVHSDTQDEESAWYATFAAVMTHTLLWVADWNTATNVCVSCRTALHRALYWGNFSCAAVLLAANAHLTIADSKVGLPVAIEYLKVDAVASCVYQPRGLL